jgi:hypothetical protein
MDQLAETTLARHRFLLVLIGAFAGTACCWRASGSTAFWRFCRAGVCPSSACSWRRGADARDILRLVLRQSGWNDRGRSHDRLAPCLRCRTPAGTLGIGCSVGRSGPVRDRGRDPYWSSPRRERYSGEESQQDKSNHRALAGVAHERRRPKPEGTPDIRAGRVPVRPIRISGTGNRRPIGRLRRSADYR